MTSGRPAAVALDGIAKRFGTVVALERVTLEVGDGEFVCFLGPSGCGKTTLLRIIAGLERQNLGTVRMAGRDVSGLPPRERIAARVDELLALVGLARHRDRYPAQLSGGEQQRVALARAVAPSPALLLLDEPLSALDARVRVALRVEIKALQRRLGITTIMVTHDQEEALTMADRIVVMNHGVVEQIGTPFETYTEPASLFVARFVGRMNVLAAVASERPGWARVGRLELRHRAGAARPAGTRLALAIRPEEIRVGTPTPEAVDNRVAARVVTVQFLGAFARLSLALPGDGGPELECDLAGDALADAGAKEGAELALVLTPEALRVFPEPA